MLKGLRSDQPALSAEAEAAARARLLAGTAASRPKPHRRFRRPVFALVAATAAATTAVLAVNAAGDGPLRNYSSPVMAIEKEEGKWHVEIKDAYADPEEFSRAFAKMGLDIDLRIVPVSPRGERRVTRVMLQEGAEGVPEGGAHSFSINDCPVNRPECPLSMTITGDALAGGWQVWLGREARPGEPYADSMPGCCREPLPGVRLIGRSVRDVTALLRERELKTAFLLGEFQPDGSGSSYGADPSWRPSGGRKVTGAWSSSSDTVTLLVSPRPGDPDPVPGTDPSGG
ncbi:hypothetical protein GCM10010439_52940 [Actinocorallia aurantiaca]|uniref:PASTA domain-containing protein n=1 Tax=Actinocorallia aurantiaca TaxID=46204 RepID=A0ABN3UI66_9ACTN